MTEIVGCQRLIASSDDVAALKNSWQSELENIITSPQQLFKLLELDECLIPQLIGAHEQFQLRVTAPYLKRIKKGCIEDPLLKQILPSGLEIEKVDGFVSDPLQEDQSNPCKGLLHKYKSRVLFIVATQCAINCRYCFRRHFPYTENNASRSEWRESIEYIEDDKNVNEVIFSGGDPLVVGDRQLSWLMRELETVSHLKRLRIHTRLPIVLPNRICDELLSWLANSRLKPIVVIHCNHPQEIDEAVKGALERLRCAGVTVLNQAVLLKGINDSARTLVELSEKLFEAGVMPYYLYMLDAVAGAAHFDIDETMALRLHRQLHAELPGYLVPKLMREIPGEDSKTPVGMRF